MILQAPKSSGCLVSWEDLPRIFASITVFGACLGFGAGMAILGASIAPLADGIDLPSTSIGRMFIFRGAGFLIGALLSIKLLRMPDLYFSKHMICFLLVLTAGISLALVPVVVMCSPGGDSSHQWVFVALIGGLFFIEGMCFGGIDTFSALSIAEMWGHRTQPWMQTKNLFSNFGCLIGPALVSSYGYHTAYLLVGIIGCGSMIGFLFDFGYNQSREWLSLPELDSNMMYLEINVVPETLELMEQGSGDDSAHEWDNLVFPVLQNTNCKQINDDTPPGSSNNSSDGYSGNNSPRGFDYPSPQNTVPTAQQPFASAHSTLTLASPELARVVHRQQSQRQSQQPVGIVLVSFNVRVLLAAFVFWELGLLCSYGGWVGTYVSSFEEFQRDDTVQGNMSGDYFNEAGAEAAGSQVLSIFYAAQIVGSLLSVPATVIYSTTALMRCQLALVVIAGALMCIPVSVLAAVGAGWVLWVTGLCGAAMGLALGCMYPLIMTLVNDYGATMTSNSTIAVVLGGCVGEAIAPFLVSVAIAQYGPRAFPVCICSLIGAMVVTYLVLHVYLTYTLSAQYELDTSTLGKTHRTHVCSPGPWHLHRPRRARSQTDPQTLIMLPSQPQPRSGGSTGKNTSAQNKTFTSFSFSSRAGILPLTLTLTPRKCANKDHADSERTPLMVTLPVSRGLASKVKVKTTKAGATCSSNAPTSSLSQPSQPSHGFNVSPLATYRRNNDDKDNNNNSNNYPKKELQQ